MGMPQCLASSSHRVRHAPAAPRLPLPALRRWLAVCLLPAVLLGPAPASAQPAGLPELGDTASSELSPMVERRLGEAIMQEGRRDPTYVDDPAIGQYLTEMGLSLAERAAGSVPEVEIFAIRDPSINAFALPGGFVGIHSGLVVTARNESELAGVVAHEIGHVVQRHVARRLASQGQTAAIMIGTMLAAIAAAAAGGGDLAQGAAIFGQAAAIEAEMSASRTAEREADRVGFQMLSGSAYDPRGMETMFARLMASSRLNETPGRSYASSHPMSLDRMSDMQNRTRGASEHGYGSSDTFWFARAKLWALQSSGTTGAGDPVRALQAEAVRETDVRKTAAQYGVAQSLLLRNDPKGARASYDAARAGGIDHPMLAQLGVELALANNQPAQALKEARAAWQRWPNQRALAVTLARTLQRADLHEEAAEFLLARIQQWPTSEPRLYRMAAESQVRLGRGVAEKRNMAEFYVLTGALPAAVGQLQQARQESKDFYEQSTIDARVNVIRRQIADEEVLLKRFRS